MLVTVDDESGACNGFSFRVLGATDVQAFVCERHVVQGKLDCTMLSIVTNLIARVGRDVDIVLNTNTSHGLSMNEHRAQIILGHFRADFMVFLYVVPGDVGRWKANNFTLEVLSVSHTRHTVDGRCHDWVLNCKTTKNKLPPSPPDTSSKVDID